MIIKVLGSGCANCTKLEALVKKVINQFGIEASVEKVKDFKDIMGYGVMSTPGLVIDEKVVFSGSVPSEAKVTELITTELAKKG